MISERKLKKWRKEALVLLAIQRGDGSGDVLGVGRKTCNDILLKFLAMNQELLDRLLIDKEGL